MVGQAIAFCRLPNPVMGGGIVLMPILSCPQATTRLASQATARSQQSCSTENAPQQDSGDNGRSRHDPRPLRDLRPQIHGVFHAAFQGIKTHNTDRADQKLHGNPTLARVQQPFFIEIRLLAGSSHKQEIESL